MKRGSRPVAVVGERDPDRAVARQQRDVEPRRRAELAGHVLHDLGVVEHGVDPLAATSRQHRAGLGLVRDHLVQQLIRLFGGDRLDAQAVGRRQRDRDDASVDQLAQPLDDELQQPRELELAGQSGADLLQRLELP